MITAKITLEAASAAAEHMERTNGAAWSDDVRNALYALANDTDAIVTDDRFENVRQYDLALNRLEIAPNGDDYNAIMALLDGGDYTAPKAGGR